MNGILKKKTNKMTQISNNKNDIVRIVSNGKEIDKVSMSIGSVNWGKGININNKENDGININGDKNGAEVFTMLAKNSPYEWEQTKTGKNSNGNNVITSSSDKRKNTALNIFIDASKIPIRGDNHSHPLNTPYPSLFRPSICIICSRWIAQV